MMRQLVSRGFLLIVAGVRGCRLILMAIFGCLGWQELHGPQLVQLVVGGILHSNSAFFGQGNYQTTSK